MLLEAWSDNIKWLNLDDSDFGEEYCNKVEMQNSEKEETSFISFISMKGCFILYGNHKRNREQVVLSRQDSDVAIMTFQLCGQFNVNEKNFEPYRIFDNDVHITFYTNKRELVFVAPPVFENFRIIFSPVKFKELLAKFHGKFSSFSDKIDKGEYFNLFDNPMPISPKMKLIIRDILNYKISMGILAKVFFETKITELFGLQLEQLYSTSESKHKSLSEIDRQKIYEARELLISNISKPPLSISKLAKLVATNDDKLKKGFKEIYGKSVYNYLMFFKIDKSIEMMDNDKLTLNEIAYEVGYADTAHFIRAFKKIKGVSPGKYKNKG